MNTLRFHAAGIFTCSLLLLVTSINAASAQDAANTAGRNAYARACAGCHGGDARGGMGPALVPMQQDTESLLALVRAGRGNMPPIAPTALSNDEVGQVAQFLRSMSAGSVPAAAAAPAGPSADVLAYGSKVSQAALGGGMALKTARSDATSMLAGNLPPSDKKLVHYAAAYASWESAVQTSNPAESRSAVTDALGQLTQAVTLDEKFGEAYILLAAIQAQNARLSEMPVPYDPGVTAALARAQVLDAKNPRFALAQGIAAFLAPRAVGAEANAAEEALKRADALFAGGAPSAGWPNWGRAQTQAWLGRVLAQKGDVAGARQAYQSALTLQPDYVWVKSVLLPALEKR
jgi:mono/diheme cytochrome c family protein